MCLITLFLKAYMNVHPFHCNFIFRAVIEFLVFPANWFRFSLRGLTSCRCLPFSQVSHQFSLFFVLKERQKKGREWNFVLRSCD